MAQFLFGRYAEFLFFVDNQQAQILEFDAFAEQFVRSDQNVDLAGGQVVGDLPHLFRAFHAAQVLDPHGEFFQPVVERSVMLQGEDRGRNQYGDLFRVGDCLESGPDRDLGLAEADVAADQPIHRRAALHILLDQLRGGLLVGRIFVDERGFQFVLQVTVRRICETFARLAFGVQRDQLAGDVLDRLFRVQLHPLPGARSQLVDFRRFALLIFVFRNAVQRVYVDQQHVVVAVDQLDRFVYLAVFDRARQSAEASYAVVDVYHVIAYLQRVKLLDRQTFAAVQFAADAIALITVEDLVVGIKTLLRNVVDESGVQRQRHRSEPDLFGADRIENIAQAFQLGFIFGQEKSFVSVFAVSCDVFGQQFEILVELRLRRSIEGDPDVCGAFGDVVVEQDEGRLAAVF